MSPHLSAIFISLENTAEVVGQSNIGDVMSGGKGKDSKARRWPAARMGNLIIGGVSAAVCTASRTAAVGVCGSGRAGCAVGTFGQGEGVCAEIWTRCMTDAWNVTEDCYTTAGQKKKHNPRYKNPPVPNWFLLK